MMKVKNLSHPGGEDEKTSVARRLKSIYRLSDEHLKDVLEGPKLSVCEAGELLGVKKRTVYALIQEGRLMAFKIKNSYRIPRVSLIDFISRQMLKSSLE